MAASPTAARRGLSVVRDSVVPRPLSTYRSRFLGLPFTNDPEASTTMAIIHTIKLPKSKARNPLGIFQERKQVMRDRRNRRPKDARKQREHFEH